MIAPAAGRAVAGKAAAKSGGKAATKKTAARKAGAPRKAAAGTAGVVPPPPEQAADQLLSGITPGVKKVSDVTGDAARSLTLTPPKRLSVGDSSGFLFGLVIYALALNGIKHGPPGIKGWLAAKFLNKPMPKPKGER